MGSALWMHADELRLPMPCCKRRCFFSGLFASSCRRIGAGSFGLESDLLAWPSSPSTYQAWFSLEIGTSKMQKGECHNSSVAVSVSRTAAGRVRWAREQQTRVMVTAKASRNLCQCLVVSRYHISVSLLFAAPP